MPTMFAAYIGVDYSGAGLPDEGRPGLRVYRATRTARPAEVRLGGDDRRHASRRQIAGYLERELAKTAPVVVGIDHGLSFPRAYFDAHGLPRDWDAVLADFVRHWPTHEAGVRVQDVREGRAGDGAARGGRATWRRVAETRARAKSVFHFGVQGSVAHATHAGLPWVYMLRKKFGRRLFCWPYDGWAPPRGVHVLAEAYPALVSRLFARGPRTPDQHDAYALAAWLRREDLAGRLPAHFAPPLDEAARRAAAFEGWILGVV